MDAKHELQLDTPVQYVKGVGPHLAKVLERRSIFKVRDLVEWYPRAYEDRRAARSISSLNEGDIVSVRARVLRVGSHTLGRSSRRIHDVVIQDDSGRIHCKFFRIPYKGYFDRLEPGKPVRVVGKVTLYRGVKEFHHPEILDLDDSDEEAIHDALVPLYTETEGLNSKRLSKILLNALGSLQKTLTEPLPAWLLEKHQLPPRGTALLRIHEPPGDAGRDFVEMTSPYHRRIIFEEFFWLELTLLLRQSQFRRESAVPIPRNLKKVEELRASLPFELTGAQWRSFEEISRDLSEPHPMHRLVQGDVGSGKTLVAWMSVVLAASGGFQSALMVPTEILAEQHFAGAKRLLEPLGLRVAFLTGSTPQKEKQAIHAGLLEGVIDLVIGTHALIEEDVQFHNLNLVIIDEQHRFGVHQRNRLKQKGGYPHFLVMTATPIPRTLAMTVYGDLEISLIDEMPKGRSPITTRVVYESKRDLVWTYLAEQVAKGRQAYVIYPLVEESEKLDLKDAVSAFENLKTRFPQIRWGLLHGRMKAAEKEEIMNQFRRNEVQVLVSTTVIEVGVDVPNATLMIIEHSERFGLSQLHQLRGRVGRGVHRSTCVLMLGYAVSEEARQRVEIMARTQNGFEIAEEDLKMRGPGEFLGTRQSGLPGFKMASIIRDLDLLLEAREAAKEVLRRDPELALPMSTGLRQELGKASGAASLAGVG